MNHRTRTVPNSLFTGGAVLASIIGIIGLIITGPIVHGRALKL